MKTLAIVLATLLIAACGKEGHEKTYGQAPLLCHEVTRCRVFCEERFNCYNCFSQKWICLHSTYESVWGPDGPLPK